MRKNNKGFVFIETIVVITFLAASLIIIYAAFTNLLTNEKRRMYYDDPIYLYRTYYILDFLQKQDVNSYVTWMLAEENSVDSENLLIEFSCSEYSVINSINASNFCESIINNQHFSVEHIYFTYYDTTPINECTNADGDSLTCENHESLDKVSANALKYIRSLGGEGKDGYRMIVEYKETIGGEDRYYYSSVFLPMGDYDKANSDLFIFDKDGWTNYDKKVVVRVDETEAGIKSIYVGPGTNCSSVPYTPYDGVREREYFFDNGNYVACFKDNDGHVTQNNYTISKVDKIPPVCTVVGQNTTWTNSNVKLDFNCSEPDGEPGRTSGCIAPTQHTENYINGTQERVNLTYTVKDIAGNETLCKNASGTTVYNVYHDKEKPVVTYLPNESLSYKKAQSSKVSVKTAATDFGSHISVRKYLWSQSTTAPSASSFTQTFVDGQELAKNSGDGTWYIWTYTKDTAGNETITSSGKINLDNSPPAVTFTPDGGASAFKHSPKVVVTDYNTVTTLKYVWSTNANASAVSGTNFTSGDTLSNQNLEGTYYLCVYAVDSLGMSSNTCSKAFKFSKEPKWTTVQTINIYHNHVGNTSDGGTCYPCSNYCYSTISRHDNRCGGYICEGSQHRCVNECSCGGKSSQWGNDNCNDDGGKSCSICTSYSLNCSLSVLGTITLQQSTNTGRTLYKVIYSNSSGYLSKGSVSYRANSGSYANYNNDAETVFKDDPNAIIIKSSGSFSVTATATDVKTNVAKSVTFNFTG